MYTAKANSITIETPPLTGGAEPVYYFHSDHLGSASWITSGAGAAVQHLLYLPFGEHFVNEQSSGYFERFTFTGKEKDIETGYYYFGARFDNVDLGFMSVDPMADKYPSISPYAYCAWNPVKLVDEDGEDWVLSTGNKVYWYAGDKGDKSTLLYTYNASSGLYEDNNDYRQAKYQNIPDKGPTPEGEYFIKLTPSPDRIAKASPKNGELLRSKQGGIEKIPQQFTTEDGTTYEYTGWGNMRALLQPYSGKVTGAEHSERDNYSYYIHDSQKCYTHGCTEVESKFFDQLKAYRDAGNKKIDIIIEYPNAQHKTVSDDCN